MPASSNDNAGSDATPVLQQDGQAEAAMLLIESLIHILIERSIITVAEAMDIADTAAAANVEIVADLAEGQFCIRDTQTILPAINASLRVDL